jgi:hypothetical protein
MRDTVRRRTQGPRGIALLAVLAVLATACGSTAYRDRQIAIAADGLGNGSAPPIATDGGTTGHLGGSEMPSEFASGTDGAIVSDTTGGGTTGTATTGGTGGGTAGTTGGTNGGTTTGTTGGTTGTTGTTGGTTGGTTSGSSLPQSEENVRATDDEIKIGFLWISSFAKLGSQAGFQPPAKGDVKAQAETLSNWINENGGIAGRKVIPVVRSFAQEESSPGLEQQFCNTFSDDDQVFAVMLVGQLQEATRYCYASKRVVHVEVTAYAYDSTLYEQTAPYYWSLATPAIDKAIRALPGVLQSQGYFDPMPTRDETETKVGVVIWDTPYTKRLFQRDLEPALAAAGQQVASLRTVDGSTIGTMQKGLTDAIVAFRNAGVNRVLFIGNAPLAPFFMNQAENEGYRPRYGMTSADQPRFAANPSEGKVPEQARDALGLGYEPDVDVEDDQYPFPHASNKTEQLCLQVLAADGHTWEARKNANIALGYCGALLMLKKGAETITQGITPELWAYHAERNLVDFESPLNFGSSYGPGDHTGPTTYRPIKWFADCGCFKYAGEPARFS